MAWPGQYRCRVSAPKEVGLSSSRRRRLALVFVIALGGIAISFSSFLAMRIRELAIAKDQFLLSGERRAEVLQNEVAEQLNVVNVLAAYFAGSNLVERKEFHTFAEQLLKEQKNIVVMGWAPHIISAQRQAHERFIRDEGFPKYTINERDSGGQMASAKMRAEYYPILFIEPYEKSKSLFGYDIQSIPECRSALQRAMTTKRPAAGLCTPIRGEFADRALLYVVMPTRDASPSMANRPADQPTADGFAFGLFRIEAIIDSALKPISAVGIDVSVVAPRETGGETLIYPDPSDWPDRVEAESPDNLRYQTQIHVADRNWSFDCVALKAFWNRRSTWEPTTVLLAGLLVTGFLVGYIFLLTGRTARVEQLVAQKTHELLEGERKFSAIFNQTFQLIGLMTPEGVLLDVNNSALEFGKVSVDQVRGKLFWKTAWWVHSEELQRELREAVKKAAQGEFVRMEATHRAENGELQWIDFSLKPVKDETGKVVFLIPEGRDITARKRMEDALNKEQHLLRNLLDLQEQDRKLVAYEIHDGLAQQLTGALYKFQSIERMKERDPDAARDLFDEAVRLLREAMGETRRLIGGLRPPVLDESGVVDAIEYLISEQRGGPEIEFVHPEEFSRLAPPVEGAIFRVVQECLTNACRYSQSEKVRVELRQTDNRVHVEVRDWGIGFDPARVGHGHYGLQGIRERARLLGGAASIKTAPGKGTSVTIELPLLPPIENGTAKNGVQPAANGNQHT
jgi:PAS domain S-box-containing protein